METKTNLEFVNDCINEAIDIYNLAMECGNSYNDIKNEMYTYINDLQSMLCKWDLQLVQNVVCITTGFVC